LRPPLNNGHEMTAAASPFRAKSGLNALAASKLLNSRHTPRRSPMLSGLNSCRSADHLL